MNDGCKLVQSAERGILVTVLQPGGVCFGSSAVVPSTIADPSFGRGPQASSNILTLPLIVVYTLTTCVRSVPPSSSVTGC